MQNSVEDQKFMQRAIELALQAEQEGNLPVGGLLTLEGEIVAEGWNRIYNPAFDVTRHAEMEALRNLPQALWKAPQDLCLYTSLEPCLMCFASILLHRIGRVVFGAADTHGGAGSLFDHLPPYFAGQLQKTEWVGPIMPQACEPLYQRLRAGEKVSRGDRGEV